MWCKIIESYKKLQFMTEKQWTKTNKVYQKILTIMLATIILLAVIQLVAVLAVMP